MAVYTIADLHFTFGTDKPMQIFSGWQDYEKRVSDNWKAIVKPEDTVVLVGDLSWGIDLDESLEDFKFVDNLPGEKLLVKGNHDYWWNTVSKMEKFFADNNITTLHFLHNNSYIRDGMALCGTRGWLYNQSAELDKKVFARELIRLEASLKSSNDFDGEKVAFLHYPPVMDGEVCVEIHNILKQYGVERCFFGHIHTRNNDLKNGFEFDGIRYRLISSICVDFVPIIV